ncbi:hypothetical protein GUITHDRAFT_120212 [Guillardia theta CCMP2712]|uniref:Orc1-like AAA ATPase domain-containing protein n=1 Tax=Guillardia theta (strain CCMP2712) TaxID=905079 RepID=L1ICG8_GUITC|nr:hypothetical protein GUITHDRAFT_120212 [Guillardia theta CCMP2712]EKX33624.1 hypothetical protein GUITHDRAFT_120212 [Guillardia theta CCMP2712]|eukprot:XP_005820604.1 hypothetical protein GUITHDRAFT_120212 [Guillardia theta CCMP2712]
MGKERKREEERQGGRGGEAEQDEQGTSRPNMNEPVRVKEMRARWIGRNDEIQQLLNIFGPRRAHVPPIFVNGHASTGKSAVVQDLLLTLKAPHAFVNCVEATTPSALFEMVLQQLCCSGRRTSSEEEENKLRCNDVSKFVRLFVDNKSLRQTCGDEEGRWILHERKEQEEEETCFLVFDRAERLRNLDPHLLKTLARMNELTSR